MKKIGAHSELGLTLFFCLLCQATPFLSIEPNTPNQVDKASALLCGAQRSKRQGESTDFNGGWESERELYNDETKETGRMRDLPLEDFQYERPAPLQKQERPQPRLNLSGAYRYSNEIGDSRNYADDDYEDFDDGDDYLDEPEEPGNFWTNPAPGSDWDERSASRMRQQRSGRTRQRSRIIASGPKPPAPVADLYNKLFWYGFDGTNDDSPADKTMFGGTKGKFNGLSYLYDTPLLPDDQRKRRTRKESSRENTRDQMSNDSMMYDELPDDAYRDVETDQGEPRRRDPFKGDAASTSRPSSSVTPPYDPPEVRRQRGQRTVTPRRRRNYANEDNRGGRAPPRRMSRGPPRTNNRKETGTDWASRTVSSWFEDDEYSQYDEEIDDRDFLRRTSPKGQRQARQQDDWSPFSAFETFMGLNRGKLQEQAALYDRRMGLGNQRRKDIARDDTRNESPDARKRRRRRSGYAKEYEGTDTDRHSAGPRKSYAEKGDFIDAEPVDADTTDDVNNSSNSSSVLRLSWEERAMAVERVPPANIPAWGPKGDLGIDARTKALQDAFEDIQAAQQLVQEKTKIVSQSKEDIAILRVDAELERKRMKQSRMDVRLVNEQIRRVDRKVEDAGRRLRYDTKMLDFAREELLEIEARHWALLGFYDASRAEEIVADALRELEDMEPAVRLHSEKLNSESTEKIDSTVSTKYPSKHLNDSLENA